MLVLKYLLVFVTFLQLSIVVCVREFDLNFQEQCIQSCTSQNRTDDTSHCGTECDIEQCSIGCKLWRHALDSSCQNVCNGTEEFLQPKQFYCIIGCNDAISRYLNQLRTKLGKLPAPALVADSLKATSLSLEWSWRNQHPDIAQQSHIKYLVQWRYEELAAAWQYCRNQTWSSKHDTVFVDNLQPYTKYRFRVAVLLWSNYEPVISEPSVVISTLPLGVPTSPPIIVRAVAVDSSRISISWEPGPFPNAPILSYVLQIVSQDHHPVLKDVPATNNTDFYMFNYLTPSENYTLSVAMRNSFGQGPSANITVATPSEYIVNQTVAILILGAHHTVIQQSADMLEEPVILYRSNVTIRGVAIHVNYKLLFISDADGFVWQKSLTPNPYRIPIVKPDSINSLPLDLTVDWLNDQLYILEEMIHLRMWQITRYSLNGQNRVVTMAGFKTKPYHIEVDPYNGYLFWVNNAGLWRLDLADSSNGIRREISPFHLLIATNLGAFTVDYTNFRILVPHQQNNTVLSVSLDGREVVDLRSNTQKPMFNNVTSIAMANGLFYWTNGEEVIAEEYNQYRDNYFHNAFPGLIDHSFISVDINIPTSQPIPVPVNPPTSVQAILGSKKAKVSWQIPHLLGGQGKGAWQNWSYELQIHDVSNDKIYNYSNINLTTSTITSLLENTEYIFKVTAYTRSGHGPWSSEFRGRTLNVSSNAKFLWSANEDLLWSDVTGDNVHILIHKLNDYHITDITWFENILFLVTNSTYVLRYDLNAKKLEKLIDIESASSIAVDWIGKKIYWSNPKQQLIMRRNINGGQHEPLPFLTLAKELNIDSINAYIYWSTGHAVECARLNGVEKRTYYPAQLFSGKQVMGLTIDIDQHYVYWIIRNFEGSILFRARTAEYFQTTQTDITAFHQQQHLQQNDIQGPLCFFSQRIMWLQDPNNTIIADLNGQNTAVLNGARLKGLKMVTVKDNSLHIYPKNVSRNIINVIPHSVQLSKIGIEGPWNKFNITWNAVTNINYGQVFYEIKVGEQDFNIITTANTVRYPKSLPPYSLLRISIRAFTYWGSAQQTRVNLHTPSSIPSKPESVRVYVTYNKQPFKNNDITATFRWSEPKHKNGIIDGYLVNCWYRSEHNTHIQLYENYQVVNDQLEFIVSNLLENTTYFFRVEAFTTIGRGKKSDIVLANTAIENYIPKLLMATEDTIFIKDLDNNMNLAIARSNVKIIDIDYMYNEEKVIWLNDLQEIFISNFNKSNRSIKLLTLNHTGVSLTVDWIQRSIYAIQFDSIAQRSSIYAFDLNTAADSIINSRPIIQLKTKIHHIEISPLTSTLYWSESSLSDDNLNIIKSSDYNGQHMQTFFSNEPGNLCNCSYHINIDRSFTITVDSNTNVNIIFINKKLQKIVEADITGCYCKIINTKTVNDYLYSLTASGNTIYYISDSEIHTNTDVVSSISDQKLEIIKLFGSYKQLYPNNDKCLMPYQTLLNVSLYNTSANSLILKMPELERDYECSLYVMPSTKYEIYYSIHNNNDCNKYTNVATTYEQYLQIDNLKPFTKYLFCLAVNNYYMKLSGHEHGLSNGVVFRTAAGAPPKVQQIETIVLNPTTIRITWKPSPELNDLLEMYQVHWRAEHPISGVRPKGELETKTECSATLQKLLPKQKYSIWIRTYSPNSAMYTDSETVQVDTYSEPNNIIFSNLTAYSVDLLWQTSTNITKYSIKYTVLGTNQWTFLSTQSLLKTIDNIYYYSVKNLKPKTIYRFQLVLNYLDFNETFHWPDDARFKIETLGDKPSAPGTPIIEKVLNGVYRIVWELADSNGSPIIEYCLEGRTEDSSTKVAYSHKILNRKQRHTLNSTAFLTNQPLQFETIDIKSELKTSSADGNDDIPENYSFLHNVEPFVNEDEVEWNWEIFYNGTENYWLISDLVPHQKYWFRVRAHNDYGWGAYSDVSAPFEAGIESSEAILAQKSQQITILLAIAVPILATICVISFCGLFCICKRKSKDNKVPPVIAPITTLGPDVELATLRDMPRGRAGGTFVHSTNVLYTSSDLPLGDSPESLPHIRRDQITLTKFLGSGAFGEVFEGKARCLDGINVETRVAVKTLRKGASDQERAEFLREAQLMAHFKHKHILKLLGVCRDNDPHFIIMELMQAGDLLSYLRSSRTITQIDEALSLQDLLEMCIDVSKGCCYLEEQHFVHRDLACRNCLVSSSVRSQRVVKIGDFGLARDIYKNDYYRKEGEGLLPVRWMAPESLVDGVFTSQSDVWAFGVLMWEIMTLGQQPYPARTNLEVLHHVRHGGRLHRPNDCPEDLHQLMLKCWSYNADGRPTFKYCLEVLESLKYNLAVNTYQINSSADNINPKIGGNEMLNKKSDSSNRNTFENVSTTEMPKYLELIYDAEDEPEPVSLDGYEVPRSSIRNKANNNTFTATVNRKRPLSANASLRRNNSITYCQKPHVVRSNSTVSTTNRRSNQFGSGYARPNYPYPIVRSNSLVHSNSSAAAMKANYKVPNNNFQNKKTDVVSELLLPLNQNVMKYCTYSNIAQAQKPLLTEIHSTSNNTFDTNKRLFNNNQSICSQ